MIRPWKRATYWDLGFSRAALLLLVAAGLTELEVAVGLALSELFWQI